MMGEGRLRDVEQRHQLTDTHLAGVLTQHIHELQADRVSERLRHLGHPERLGTIDVGIDNWLAAALPGRALRLGGQLEDRQIDAHRSTYINNTHECRCNTIPAVNTPPLAPPARRM